MSSQRVAVAARDDVAKRKELKRQRRDQQIEVRRRMEASQRRRRQLIWGGGAVLLIAVLGALIWWLVHPDSGLAVQSFPDQGGTHIQHGQTHPAYASKPPTSGWHYADAIAPWGISSQPLTDEVQVHDLEHGGVGVQYDCPDGCPDVVSRLETIVNSYRSKVFLAPYPGAGHKIVLTAWTHMLTLDNFDEPTIREFIRVYKSKYNPENIPD